MSSCAGICRKNFFLQSSIDYRYHPAVFETYELAQQGAIDPLMFLRAVCRHGGRPGYQKEWRRRF